MIEQIKESQITREKDVASLKKMAEYIGSLIDLKFISEEAGKNLISKIESDKIDLGEIRSEAKNLLRKRINALGILKNDPSLENLELEKISILHEKLEDLMIEFDLLK
jgi:uncharacterized protein YlaN (UPF0358 family)